MEKGIPVEVFYGGPGLTVSDIFNNIIHTVNIFNYVVVGSGEEVNHKGKIISVPHAAIMRKDATNRTTYFADLMSDAYKGLLEIWEIDDIYGLDIDGESTVVDGNQFTYTTQKVLRAYL